MKTMTHLLYEDLFSQIEKSGLILPVSCLEDEKNIDEILQDLVSPIDPIEAISYSSFLNTVVQTIDPGESARLGQREIVEVGFNKNPGNSKALFHRDCLLYMIAQIITGGNNGTMRITGGTDRRGTRKYYESLLLLNSKINRTSTTGDTKQTLLKDYFIRDYPLPYAPRVTSTIYKNRLQRYWHIYSRMLPSMGGSKRDLISKAISALEKDSGLTLRQHYSVLADVLSWFLLLPVEKRKKKDENINLGFDYRNLATFYIDRNNFPGTDLIQLIQFVAQDIDRLQKDFVKERRDKVSGFYKHFREFFDRPIFKIDDSRFCILDLRFLMEGICSGFLWRIKDNASVQNNFQQLKSDYGQLIEKYFIFLLEHIFGKSNVRITPGHGADAIIETDDYLLIFEFTTEYYRFASLYNASIDFLKEDLQRILFNRGKNDHKDRPKEDKGKFLKLEGYLNSSDKKVKKIIPILVTENYLGDYDLLNQFDHILDTQIQENKLANIQKYKPLILCLDDLEIFWALTKENVAVSEFGRYVHDWESANKGGNMYVFSSFISSQDSAVIRNHNYLRFFDYSKFRNELAEDVPN